MTSSKTKNQTTTSTTAPPGFISDQQQYAVQQARDLYDKGLPEYYPGQTYANMSPETQQALGMTVNRATNGSPVVGAASNNIISTLNGDYLSPDSNPYLRDTVNAADQSITDNYANTVFPTISSNFSGGGRYGSGLYENAQDQARTTLAKTLANTNSQIYSNNYSAERGNQLASANLAPTLANQDYTDIAALGQAGARQEQQTQAGINEDVNRYNYNSGSDEAALNQFLQQIGIVTPGAGGTSTNTQPVSQPSAFGQMLGLAAMGAGAYFGGPAGAAAGGSLFGGMGGSTTPGTFLGPQDYSTKPGTFFS